MRFKIVNDIASFGGVNLMRTRPQIAGQVKGSPNLLGSVLSVTTWTEAFDDGALAPSPTSAGPERFVQ